MMVRVRTRQQRRHNHTMRVHVDWCRTMDSYQLFVFGGGGDVNR
jgi:hypothetical protein